MEIITWVCIEHEVEVATKIRKHWLVYGIYQSLSKVKVIICLF